MKIGCGTVLYRKFELERALEAIRKIGFEYFETQAVGPWCPHVDVLKDDPETLLRLQKKFGFKGITGLWTLDGNLIANPQAVASGIRSVEWAAAAGIPVIHTGDGAKPKGMTDEDAFKVLGEKLSPILEAAKKHGVTMAIEPHGTFSLTKAGLNRILSLGDPSVLAVNFDACNIHRAAYVESGNNQSGWKSTQTGEDETEVLKAVLNRVVHCHAKDINHLQECVPVGSGIVRIKECIDLLKTTGYQGVVSVETEGGDDFEQITALAKESFDYLTDIIKGE